MFTYIIRRILLIVPTLIGISMVVFFVMALSPGGVGGTSLNIEGDMDSKTREAMREYYNERYGLDQPLVVQYGRWLNKISPVGFFGEAGEGFPGFLGFGLKWPDLGESMLNRRPVSSLLAERLPVTIMLNIIAAPIVYFIAIPAGLYMARHRGRDIDVLGGVTFLALWSIPVIWAGVMFIGYLANRDYIYLFPTGRISSIDATDMAFLPTTLAGWGGVVGFMIYVLLLAAMLIALVLFTLEVISVIRRLTNMDAGSIGSAVIAVAVTAGVAVGCFALATYVGLPQQMPADRGWLFDRMWHLVLPVVCLTYAGFATLSKLMRGALLENLSAHFVRTARAKGVSEHDVLWHHAFRNSLLPLITVAAGILPGLLGGSIIVESIFSIPGMGSLMIEAINARDREVILAATMIGGLLGLTCILLADLAYAVADPRVSYE